MRNVTFPAETSKHVPASIWLIKAKVLGIRRTKFCELMLSKALESVKIGGSRRIPVDSLSTFVDTLRAQGA